MTKKELATAAGVSPARIEQLYRELLILNEDYEVIINPRNSTQIMFFDSALAKIKGRVLLKVGRKKKGAQP